jgi:Asp/Glu/hydantoin racemase
VSKIRLAALQRQIGCIDPGTREENIEGMARILVINPNSSEACSAGISAALEPYRFPTGPVLDVVTLKDGPPAIYSWSDWHAVVEPLCGLVQRSDADAYVIACASDPGLEAVRAVTLRPVFGIFRSAVATAVAHAERLGVIALVESSKARHRLGLRAMGLEGRLAGEIALNVSMDSLLDPAAARCSLIAAARDLVGLGAETLILGCTGMAHHATAIRDAVRLPVIEPSQAAAALAIGAVLSVAR